MRYLFYVLSGFAALTLSGPGAAAPLGADVLPAPGSQVWLGERRMHIHCSGRGAPAVVLDAGLGGTSLEWTRVQPPLSRLTRVCSYDRAGYGWSDPGPAPRTAARIAADLDRLLDVAGVRTPYLLVGHSFGGLALRLYAQQRPEHVAGLVMLDSTHERQFDDRDNTPKARTALLPHRRGALIIGNQSQIPAGIPQYYRHTAQALARLPAAALTLRSELLHLRDSAAELRATAWPLPDVPLTVIAHDSRARARTERARRFARRWLALQRELSQRTSRGRLIIADDSSHHIHLDRPDVVIDAVSAMLAELRGGR